MLCADQLGKVEMKLNGMGMRLPTICETIQSFGEVLLDLGFTPNEARQVARLAAIEVMDIMKDNDAHAASKSKFKSASADDFDVAGTYVPNSDADIH